jgi:hypothetical protein
MVRPYPSSGDPLRMRLCTAGLVVIAAALALMAPPASDARVAETANPFTAAASRKASIQFVPLDTRARGLIVAIFPAVQRYLHHPSVITAVPTAKPSWINAQRRQMNSAVVMNDIAARFRRAQGNKIAVLLMVTSQSMYASEDVSFAFTVWGAALAGIEQRRTLTATAQMRVYHPEREKARLTKIILRHIGEILCRLPRNSNPKSVMYTPLLSDADIDRMVAVLPARC